MTKEYSRIAERIGEFLASADKATGTWAEKRRLASAMRLVIARLIESDAPEKDLARAADGLERYADHLASHPRGNPYEGWAESAPAGTVAGLFDRSPLVGLSNPLAPPIVVEADVENKLVFGRVVFGSAYEGPPGCVHGGFVAAAFDEILGFANSISGNPGMTARLIVNYRRPTPLHTELRLTARLDRVDGRKIYASGEIRVGDDLMAEAEGLFVSVGSDHFRKLFEARERRAAG